MDLSPTEGRIAGLPKQELLFKEALIVKKHTEEVEEGKPEQKRTWLGHRLKGRPRRI